MVHPMIPLTYRKQNFIDDLIITNNHITFATA
jgi:hypothetical protein